MEAWHMTPGEESGMLKLVERVNGCLYHGDRLDAIMDTVKALRADPDLAVTLGLGSLIFGHNDEVEVRREWAYRYKVPGDGKLWTREALMSREDAIKNSQWVKTQFPDTKAQVLYRTVITGPWHLDQAPVPESP